MISYVVCMATYNGQTFIHDQILSIVTQLRNDEKLFISDDGSNDQTVEIAKSYGDRVWVVDSRRAGGVVANFERVLTAAYDAGACNIILADQDDKWLDGRMDSIREHLARVDMLMMNGYVTDSGLNPTGGTIFDQRGVRRGLFSNLVRPTYVGCCMAFKREILAVALPFPCALPWHDWYISLIGELYFQVELDPRPSIYYRRHGNNQSNTCGKSSNSLAKKFAMRVTILKAMAMVIYRHLRGLSLP